MEENLLSQIRAVYTNQLMCVWIHGKTLVRLRVGKFTKISFHCVQLTLFFSLFTAELNPKNDFIKLTTNTEVIVAPKVRQLAKPTDLNSSQLSATDEQKVVPHICLRNLPDPDENDNHCALEHGLSIVVHPDDLSGIEIGMVRLTKVTPGYESSSRKSASTGASASVPTSGTTTSNNGTNDDKEGGWTDLDLSSPAKAVYAHVQISTSIPRQHVSLGAVIKTTLDLGDFDIIK